MKVFFGQFHIGHTAKTKPIQALKVVFLARKHSLRLGKTFKNDPGTHKKIQFFGPQKFFSIKFFFLN